MSAHDFTTDTEGRSTPCAGSASRARVKARMEGAAAALEKRKLGANDYPEESDLHFEWLAGWVGARTEMMKTQNESNSPTPALSPELSKGDSE